MAGLQPVLVVGLGLGLGQLPAAMWRKVVAVGVWTLAALYVFCHPISTKYIVNYHPLWPHKSDYHLSKLAVDTRGEQSGRGDP